MAFSQNYLDILNIGLLIVNESGLVLEKNQTFINFFLNHHNISHLTQLELKTLEQKTLLDHLSEKKPQKLKLLGYKDKVFETQIHVIQDNKKVNQILISFNDITETERLVESLKIESEIDHLTGIHNRRRFDKEFRQLLEYCKRTGESGALVIFDIDSFKEINDQWGHAVGDEVLQTIGRLTPPIIRQYELFSRIGGDEFAILIGHSATQAIERIQKQLVEVLAQTKIKNSQPSRSIRISIGCALFEEANWQQDAIYNLADQNLYKNKKQKTKNKK